MRECWTVGPCRPAGPGLCGGRYAPRTRRAHIARRDLFIRELVEREVISPKFVTTVKNVADVLTKPVKKDTFLKHRVALLGIQ